MRALWIAAGLCLGTALPALAALPPQYQRQQELEAIVQTAAIIEAFKNRPIEAIEWVGDDLYRVTAGPCSMEVRIADAPDAPAMPGPRAFVVQPGALVCR